MNHTLLAEPTLSELQPGKHPCTECNGKGWIEDDEKCIHDCDWCEDGYIHDTNNDQQPFKDCLAEAMAKIERDKNMPRINTAQLRLNTAYYKGSKIDKFPRGWYWEGRYYPAIKDVENNIDNCTSAKLSIL